MEYVIAQKYIIFVIGIMLSTGIIKKYNLFADFYSMLFKYVKSNRLVVFFISFFGGILPIPGRVVVSAGLLNSIAPCCSSSDCNAGEKMCRKSRSKFGIIDYISTHHYYLWSPLEKTVILPMAAAGITWSAFIGIVYPILLITVFYIWWYIFYKLQESDIIIDRNIVDFKWINIIKYFAPFILSLAILIVGFSGEFIFLFLSIYFIFITGERSLKVLNSFINWPLIIVLIIVLCLGVFFNVHASEITNYLETHYTLFNMESFLGVLIISSLSFIASWLLGSSGKYAGIVAGLIVLFGTQYLLWFLVIEFIAYNFSPMHKCIPIGSMYFGTPVRRYFEAVGTWQMLLFIVALVLTFII